MTLAAFLTAAATVCLPSYSEMVAALAAYQEREVSRGIDSTTGAAAITFASDGGTWSLVFVDPTGVSCLMAAGSNFMILVD